LMKWYYDNYDLLNLIYSILLKWINDNNINIISTEKEFYNNFIQMIYDDYVLNKKISTNVNIDEDVLEYFEMLYDSDIVNIFIEFKDIALNYNSDLFNNNCSSYNLMNFIEKNIELSMDDEALNIVDSDIEFIPT